jgi:hypothetical protein
MCMSMIGGGAAAGAAVADISANDAATFNTLIEAS